MQGERALLLYPSGLEFIAAFFGCLYAGVIAVPVNLPRQNQKLSRLLSVVNDAQAKVALTTTPILADIEYPNRTRSRYSHSQVYGRNNCRYFN
jgi:acyl-CoA synthetase (AMP-forming)/AMP-acid ligase II